MTLFKLFKEQNLSLPSVERRKQLYSRYKLGTDYKGSFEQNTLLSKAIKKDPREFNIFVNALKFPLAPTIIKSSPVKSKVKSVAKLEPVKISKSLKKESFEYDRLTPGKTVGDWLKAKKIKFEDFQKLNPAYKTQDFKVESPFKVKIPKLDSVLIKEFPKVKEILDKKSGEIKDPADIQKILRQSISNLLIGGIKALPEIIVKGKNLLPAYTKNISEGIKQTKISVDKKNLATDLGQKEKAYAANWDPVKILDTTAKTVISLSVMKKGFRPISSDLISLIKKSQKLKLKEKQEKERKLVIPSVEDFLAGEKIDLSSEEKKIITKPKEENESPEYTTARLKNIISKLDSIKKDIQLQQSNLKAEDSSIIGLINKEGKFLPWETLEKDTGLAKNLQSEIEAMSKKIGPATNRMQENTNESIKWQNILFKNLDKYSDVIFNLISDPEVIKDPTILTKVQTWFPNRESFLLGVTKSPTDVLVSTPEVKKLQKEMESLLTPEMKEIIDNASKLDPENDEQADKFWLGLSLDQQKSYQRLMTLNRLIGEKDDATKLQKTWALLEDPYFQKTILESAKYLSEDQKKIIQPVIEIAKLNAERTILWPKVDNEMKSQTEEIKNKYTEYQKLVEGINQRIVALGDPKKQGTLAHWLVDYGDAIHEYQKSLLKAELKSEKKVAEFQDAYIEARSFKSVSRNFMNAITSFLKNHSWEIKAEDEKGFFLKLRKSQEEILAKDKLKIMSQVVFPTGFKNYFIEGGYKYDLPIAITPIGYEVTKNAFSGLQWIWDRTLPAAEVAVTALSQIGSTFYQTVLEETGDLWGMERKKVEELTTIGEFPFKEKNLVSKLWNLNCFNFFNLYDAANLTDLQKIAPGKRFEIQNLPKWIDLKKGGYLPTLYSNYRHPRSYQEIMIKSRMKAVEVLPSEFKIIQEEFLSLNNLNKDSVLSIGDRILIPTQGYIAPRNLIKPNERTKMEQTSDGRLALLAIDFIGWGFLDPTSIFWTRIGSLSKSIFKNICPQLYNQLKTRKDLYKFANEYSRASDLAEDLMSFASLDAIPGGKFKEMFPSLINSRKAFMSLKVLDNLDPKVLAKIEKYAQEGELWRSGYFSKLFIDNVKTKVGKDKLKTFQDSLRALMLEGKIPAASDNLVWEVLNQFGGNGFDLIKQIANNGPKALEIGLNKVVKNYHSARLREYLLKKNLDKTLYGLSPLERNQVLNLSQKTEAQITKELNLMRELGKGKTFKERFLIRPEFTPKSINKIEQAVKQTKINLLNAEKILKESKVTINLPDSYKILYNLKKEGKNYFDIVNKQFVVEQLGKRGVPGLIKDWYSQVGTKLVTYLDNITGYFSESTLMARKNLTYSEIVNGIKQGHGGLGLRLLDTVRFKDKDMTVRALMKELEKVAKGQKSKATFLSTKWPIKIPLQKKQSSSLLDAIYKSIKFDSFKNKDWVGMNSYSFKELLGKVQKLDKNFVPVSKTKDVYNTLPLQWFNANKNTQGYAVFGGLPSRHGMSKIIKVKSKEKLIIQDPKDFKAYFEEAVNLYFLQKYSPLEYKRYQDDLVQMVKRQTDKQLKAWLTPQDRIALLIFENEKKGIASLPNSIIDLFESLTGSADDIKRSITLFLNKRMGLEKEQILASKKAELIKSFKAHGIKEPEREWLLYRRRWNFDLVINPQVEEFATIHNLLSKFPILSFKKTSKLIPAKYVTRLEKNSYPFRSRYPSEIDRLFYEIQQGGRKRFSEIISEKKSLPQKIEEIKNIKAETLNIQANNFLFCPSASKLHTDRDIRLAVQKYGSRGNFIIPGDYKNAEYARKKFETYLPQGRAKVLKKDFQKGSQTQFVLNQPQFIDDLKNVNQLDEMTLGGVIPEKKLAEFWAQIPEDLPSRKIFKTGKYYPSETIGAGVRASKLKKLEDQFGKKIAKQKMADIEKTMAEQKKYWLPQKKYSLGYDYDAIDDIQKNINFVMKDVNDPIAKEFKSWIRYEELEELEKNHKGMVIEIFEILSAKKRVLNSIFSSKEFYVQKNNIVFTSLKGVPLDTTIAIGFTKGKVLGKPRALMANQVKAYVKDIAYKNNLSKAEWPKDMSFNKVSDDIKKAFYLNKYNTREQFRKGFKEVIKPVKKGKTDKALNKLMRDLDLEKKGIVYSKLDRYFTDQVKNLYTIEERGSFLGTIKTELELAKKNLNFLNLGYKKLISAKKSGKKYIYLKKQNVWVKGEKPGPIMKDYVKDESILWKPTQTLIPEGFQSRGEITSKMLMSENILTKSRGTEKISIDNAIKSIAIDLQKQRQYVPKVESLERVFGLFNFKSEYIKNLDDFIDALWDISHKNPSSKATGLVGEWRTNFIINSRGPNVLRPSLIDLKKHKLKIAEIKAYPIPKLTKFIESQQIANVKFPISMSKEAASLKTLRHFNTNIIVAVDLKIPIEISSKYKTIWKSNSRNFFPIGSKFATKEEINLTRKVRDAFFNKKKVVFVGENADLVRLRVLSLFPPEEFATYKGLFTLKRIPAMRTKTYPGYTWEFRKGKRPILMNETEKKLLTEILPKKDWDDLVSYLKSPGIPRTVEEIPAEQTKRLVADFLSDLENSIKISPDYNKFWISKTRKAIGSKVKHVKVELPTMLSFSDIENLGLLKNAGVNLYIERVSGMREAALKQLRHEGINPKLISSAKAKQIHYSYVKGKKGAGQIYEKIQGLKSNVFDGIKKDLNIFFKDFKKVIPVSAIDRGTLRKSTYEWLDNAYALKGKKDLITQWKGTSKILTREFRDNLENVLLKEFGTLNNKVAQNILARKMSKFDDYLKLAEEMKLGFGGQKRLSFYSIGNKLKALINSGFEWVAEKKVGTPLTMGEKGMILTLQALDKTIKTTDLMISLPLRTLRTMWIWGVLFLRPGWHLNNMLGDSLRGTMASHDLKYFIDSSRQFSLLTTSYLKFLGRDIRSLFYPLYRNFIPTKLRKFNLFKDPLKVSRNEMRKVLKQTVAPNTVKNKRRLKLLLKNYDLTFNPKTIRLLHAKSPISWAPKKVFKSLSSPQYWSRKYKIPMSSVEQAAHMGMLTALEDPIYASKLWKLMAETGIKSAIKKRATLLKLDITLYANINEKMRRLLLLDSLMKNKAMSLAKASMRVKSYIFDYSHLSRAERVFRIICPFWSFSRFSVELYTKILLKEGPKFYWAGKFFIEALDEVSKNLPEQFKNRIPIPFTGTFAYLPFGIIDYWRMMANPKEELLRFVDNPLQMPFGLGMDPMLGTTTALLIKRKWYETSRILKDNTGWTDEQIKKEMDKFGAPNLNMLIDFPTFLSNYFPPAAIAGIVFPSLFKVDRATIEDEFSVIQSTTLRSLFKWFGFNILKEEPWMEFGNLYEKTAPHLRPFLIEKTKKENPFIYEAWENFIAKTKMLNLLNARTPDEKVLAMHDLEKFEVVSKYYELEEQHKGYGTRWIESMAAKGNMGPKALLQEHFNYDINESSWRREQKAKYDKMQAKIFMKQVEKEFVAKITPTTGAAMDVLNIPHPDVGFKEAFESQIYDGYGNVRFDTVDEAIQASKEMAEKYNLDNLVPEEIKSRINQESQEWKLRSWEAKEQKKLEDSKYYAQLGVAYSYIPENIDKLSAEQQRLVYAKRDKYISGMSKEFQSRWKESQPEYIQHYKELLNTAYDRIGSIYKKCQISPYDKNYYVEFEKLPEWIKNLHFVYHPEDKDIIPFKAELFRRFQIDRKQNLKGYSSNKRDSFYFSNDLIAIKGRKAIAKDDPVAYEFSKLSQDLSYKVDLSYQSGSLVGYYTLFNTMPAWWKDRFWELKEESVKSGWLSEEDYDMSKKWFEFNSRLEKAKIKDRENLENGIISNLNEKIWFEKKYNDVKNWNEKNEMNKGYKLYTRLQFQFNRKVEKEGPQNYYLFVKNLPEEAKLYYLRHHLDSIQYIDFMAKYNQLFFDKEFIEDSDAKANDFFWAPENTIARNVYFQTHPNEEYYRKERERIFALANTAGEYYDLILSAPQKFQDIYFKKHPLAKLYLSEVQKYFKAISIDEENKRKGIKSNLAKEVFKSKSFQSALKIWDKADKGVYDYYTGWFEISELVDKKGVDKWGEIYEQYIKSHLAFKEQLKLRQPKKYKILYPFKIEMGKLSPDKAQEFFLADKNAEARKMMEAEDPGIIAYYKFWQNLSSLADKGHWQRYFRYYFSDQNKANRLRHWDKHPEAKKTFPAWMKYQLMPANNWEERKKKSDYLESNLDLKKFFQKDLTVKDLELRKKIDDYFKIRQSVKEYGTDLDYFFDWRKKGILANKYLEKNPEVLEYLQSHSKQYGDEQKGLIQELSETYDKLETWTEKDRFIDKHPEFLEFLIRYSPPGIRKVIKLQRQYFNFEAEDWDSKNKFLNNFPELKNYWEIKSYPEIFFTNSIIRKKYLDIDKKVLDYYNEIKSSSWAKAELLRKNLPSFYNQPGSGKIAEWFIPRIYREAMSAWSSLLKRNKIGGIAFFRQLPSWIRDKYLKANPQYNLISKYSLERFLEEPLRLDLLAKSKLRTYLAEKIHYKYSSNVPYKLQDKIRKEFIRAGIWKSRAHWQKADWQNYYLKRAIEKNNLIALDLYYNPLLRKELERLSKLWLTRGRIIPFKRRIVPHEVKLID